MQARGRLTSEDRRGVSQSALPSTQTAMRPHLGLACRKPGPDEGEHGSHKTHEKDDTVRRGASARTHTGTAAPARAIDQECRESITRNPDTESMETHSAVNIFKPLVGRS